MKFIFFLLTGILAINNGAAQNESTICRNLFTSSYDVTKTSTDAISLAVDAVWEASGLNNNVKTTTGTLTQNPYNGSWAYSPSPNDRLNLNFANGASVSFTFYQIDGYTGGDAEDFKNSHMMDFNSFIQNYLNMRINSSTSYPEYGKINWTRTITGTMVYDNQLNTLNVNHSGKIDFDVSSGWAIYEYTEQASGISSTPSFSINISEAYWRKMIHNSDAGQFVMNTEITNNSSANYGGTTYKYQNGYVFWAAGTQFADSATAGVYNQAIDAGYWKVQGTMLKNGESYGFLMFNGPVINYTSGPDLVLHLNNGTDIPIHTLIGMPISGIKETNGIFIKNYELMQNFPNPFNSSTVIRWNMMDRNRVTITIYNILGEKILTVLDEERPEGINEVKFENKSVNSGIYFYKLTVGNFSSVKKMVLTK